MNTSNEIIKKATDEVRASHAAVMYLHGILTNPDVMENLIKWKSEYYDMENLNDLWAILDCILEPREKK